MGAHSLYKTVVLHNRAHILPKHISVDKHLSSNYLPKAHVSTWSQACGSTGIWWSLVGESSAIKDMPLEG